MMTAVSAEDLAVLRTLRAEQPTRIADALAARVVRPLLRDDNRLFIVAADHTARGALGVRGNPMAMADRGELLRRIAVALENPAVDGVLGTADIIEDLALLGLLNDRIVVGSMNRGGLRGASFELDDRFTGYDIEGIRAARLDAGKLLLRIDPSDHGSVSTLESVGRAVTAAAAARLPIMLEPFMSRRVAGAVVNDLDADSVIHSVAIASGLGASSAFSWLKLPVVDEMERVMAATTLPTLLLGGDPDQVTDATFTAWERTLALPGVRGLVVGRTLLYPPDDDVAAAVDTAARLVHRG